MNWHFSSHLNSFLSLGQLFKLLDLSFMVLDLGFYVLVLDLRLSLLLPDEAIMESSSDNLWGGLGLEWSLRLALLRIVRSTHLDGLLIERIRVGVHSVNIWLLHLDVLVHHLLSHDARSSLLGNTEFDQNKGQDKSSEYNSVFEHLIIDLSLMSSLLSLFFSHLLHRLIFFFNKNIPSAAIISTSFLVGCLLGCP